jgi:alpha-L-rhamnosidase
MDQFITDFALEGVMTKWWQDICDAMTDEGELPGIVPTPKWGYHWGNGPVSEGTLFEIPYRIYLHTGDDALLIKGLPYFKRNIAFLNKRKNENGDILYGLDDWAAPCDPKEKVNTAFINRVLKIKCLGITLLAAKLAGESTEEIKSELDSDIMAVKAKYLNPDGTCNYDKQTAVAMMIYFDLYDDIKPLAAQLKRLVEEKDFHHECGMVGLRYLYIALNKAGLQEYAFKIINANGFPSYRAWVDDGATTLYEYWDSTTSKNHHMYSDFMSWMIKTLAGIHINQEKPGELEYILEPVFLAELDWVKCSYETVCGKIAVSWKRDAETIVLTVEKEHGVKLLYEGKELNTGKNVMHIS